MKCDTPFYILPKGRLEKVPVACGKCPPCKISRVNSWVFRLQQEGNRSQSSHFVTLTYDTDHIPITGNGFMTLSKRDIQLFFKRLRKLTPNVKLKYYIAGEYGTQRGRPHYHAIVFNCPDTSLFNEAWQLGGVYIGTVSGDSIAYTMKYIDKSNFKKKHERDDRQPEFSLMSKGMGANYLTDEVVRYHKSDIRRLYLTKLGNIRIALPRYYRQKIYSEDEQREQTKYIQSHFEDTDKKELRYYLDANPDKTEADYRARQLSVAYQRNKSFYSRQKNRD